MDLKSFDLLRQLSKKYIYQFLIFNIFFELVIKHHLRYEFDSKFHLNSLLMIFIIDYVQQITPLILNLGAKCVFMFAFFYNIVLR